MVTECNDTKVGQLSHFHKLLRLQQTVGAVRMQMQVNIGHNSPFPAAS